MIKIPKLNLADVEHPLEDLAGQFIIGESNFEAPSPWKTTTLGHLLIICDPRLPVSTVMGKLEPIALFLGWPIHPELATARESSFAYKPRYISMSFRWLFK